MNIFSHLCRRPRRARGAALVAVLWVVIALMAVVFVLARRMTIEALSAKQREQMAKCDAAEIGVEQYVLNSVGGEIETPGYLDALNTEARELGDCWFWILTPNLDDEQQPAYGITDVASKLDLNSATYDQLMLLPGMTDEFASSIIDWRDADDDVTGTDGAEDSYYMALDTPYHCKSAPFESVDELWLVRGATPDILYGADLNHNDTIEPKELNAANAGVAFQLSARGVLSYVTVYSSKATNPATQPADTTGTTTTSTTAVTATTQPALPDINATDRTTQQALSTALQTYLPAKANQVAQQTTTLRQRAPFTSLFNWAVQLQLTSQDLTAIYPYVVCNAVAAATQTATVASGGVASATSQPAPPPPGKVNLNTATSIVLAAIGINQTEVDAIVAYRTSNQIAPEDKANIAWVFDLIDPSEFTTNTTTGTVDVGQFLTGASTGYSADIVTVTKDGRAFKRVRIVVDAAADTIALAGQPIIIYRRDLTSGGWPLDPDLRASLRAGTGLDGSASGSRASQNNGLSLGIK